jgi:Raf kinase inhibitor-like YbhB/YbcL family protein
MRLALAFVAVVALAACSSSTSDASHELSQMNIPTGVKVTSPAFANNEPIPEANTCDGAGLPPKVAWSALPPNTKSVAVVVDDPDAGVKPFVHWIVIGLPPENGSVPSTGKTVRELDNTGGTTGWTAPCPPAGSPHRYRFTVYALRDYVCAGDADDIRTSTCSPPGAADALDRIAGTALAKGTLVGTYQR